MTTKTASRSPGMISNEAILFAILIACHASLRFTNIAVQLVPDSAIVTIAVFLVVGAFWAADLASPETEKQQQRNQLVKWVLVMLAIGLITILPTVLMIIWHVTEEAPHSFAHDSVIQTEVAINFLLDGKNPYVEDYFGTPFEDWPPPYPGLSVNPAIYHYIYMPFMFLFPLPFQVLGEALWGWFDQRLLYLVALPIVLFVGQRLIRDPSKQLMWLLIMGLSPTWVPSFIEGRNDMPVILWVVLAIFMLHRGRMNVAAILLALACNTKQFSWFLVPFFFVYVAGTHIAGADTLKQGLRRAAVPFITFCLTFGVIVLPFIIWNPAAFFEDTLSFYSGSTEHTLPIAGFGFSMVLPELGIIDSVYAPFPHGRLQMLFGLPVLAVLLIRQWRHNQLRLAIVHYTMGLFVSGFFGRRFFDSYLSFIIALATLAMLMVPPEREIPSEDQA
jgi:hypothetical protein